MTQNNQNIKKERSVIASELVRKHKSTANIIGWEGGERDGGRGGLIVECVFNVIDALVLGN